jgi:outer membrane receptor protein involved in Fe transport
MELVRVIVTATRRKSPVEQVPVSVTAFSADTLNEMGALEFEDYVRSVPGMSFTDAGRGGNKYVIRGVSTGLFSESRAATSVYLDETPITDGGFGALSYSPDPLLVDIERLEVLRGPQGTLFGSGSMGGAIRIITSKPDFRESQGFVKAGLSGTSRGGMGYELQAMFNTPLSEDDVAIRGVAYYRDVDGWIDNTVLGNDDANNSEIEGLRLAGAWAGSERLRIDAKIAYQTRKSDGSGLDEGNPPWTQQRLVEEPNSDDWTLLNLEVNYGFDGSRLIATTSWMDRSTEHDADATWVYLGPDPFSTATAVSRGEQQGVIQEFRLQSDGNGHLDWLLGLFYQDQDYRLEHEVVVPGFDEWTGGLAAAAGAPDRLLVASTKRPTEQVAVFGDIIWRISEHWESTLGGRWFEFDYSSESSARGLLSGPGRSYQTSASESGFTPKFSLSYLANDDLMLYGTVAAGFRPGGANEAVFEEFPECMAQLEWLGLTGIPQSYESDSLWNYEAGIKSNWASQQVHLNATAFLIDWSEMQTPAGLPCGANWVQNAGAATSKGVEVELVAYPRRDLEFRLNWAWTDARLDEDVPLMGGRDGDRVPGVPEHVVGGSASWFYQVFDDAEGSIRLEYQYVDGSPNAYSYWFDPGETPSHSLANLRLGLRKGRWQTSLSIENMLNERAVITVHDNIGWRYVTTARPLTVGISTRYSF